MTRAHQATLLVALATCACGRDCPGAYTAQASMTGTLTRETSEGTTSWAVSSDDVCKASLRSKRSERGVEVGSLTPLSVNCQPEDGAASLGYFNTPRDYESARSLDLTTASEGEERRFPAQFGGPTEAVLTVTRAEGTLRPYPEGPSDDYVREFTLTAVFDCSQQSDVDCDGRRILELTGRQTPEHFWEQCSANLDE